MLAILTLSMNAVVVKLTITDIVDAISLVLLYGLVIRLNFSA